MDDLTDINSYDKFRDEMDKNVTFMLEKEQSYTAPVWLGEFGTNTKDK